MIERNRIELKPSQEKFDAARDEYLNLKYPGDLADVLSEAKQTAFTTGSIEPARRGVRNSSSSMIALVVAALLLIGLTIGWVQWRSHERPDLQANVDSETVRPITNDVVSSKTENGSSAPGINLLAPPSGQASPKGRLVRRSNFDSRRKSRSPFKMSSKISLPTSQLTNKSQNPRRSKWRLGSAKLAKLDLSKLAGSKPNKTAKSKADPVTSAENSLNVAPKSEKNPSRKRPTLKGLDDARKKLHKTRRPSSRKSLPKFDPLRSAFNRSA